MDASKKVLLLLLLVLSLAGFSCQNNSTDTVSLQVDQMLRKNLPVGSSLKKVQQYLDQWQQNSKWIINYSLNEKRNSIQGIIRDTRKDWWGKTHIQFTLYLDSRGNLKSIKIKKIFTAL